MIVSTDMVHLFGLELKKGVGYESIPRDRLFELLERRLNSPSAITYTVVAHDKVIAIIGLVQIYGGFYEAWAFIGEDSVKYPKVLYKDVKNVLDFHIQDLNIVRVQASSSGTQDLDAWFTKLGFEKEGVMRKAGLDGGDLILWGRV